MKLFHSLDVITLSFDVTSRHFLIFLVPQQSNFHSPISHIKLYHKEEQESSAEKYIEYYR